MGRLFIFAIGGTGARVLKSLTMLLAAGVKIKASEIIPMVLDPDRANGDLNRTLDILRLYQKINKKLNDQGGKEITSFFNVPVLTLSEKSEKTLSNKNISEDFRLSIGEVHNERFKHFIDHGSLDRENKALIDALFSEKNLEADMEVGFKGNPNIGSVVLNRFKDSEEFRYFASSFSQNDRIFIISSIFGGTGAAGFPLLVKNIRNAEHPLANANYLKQSKIGAITMLPYFGIEHNANGEIDRSSFISKAKSALYYYANNLTGKSLNALYYFADELKSDYEYHDGQQGQRNAAHFAEFAAALAVIDFMNISDENLTTDADGRVLRSTCREFGIREIMDSLDLTCFGDNISHIIRDPLIKFQLMSYYIRTFFRNEVDTQPYANTGSIKITTDFFNSDFYRDLNSFFDHYCEWIKEMKENKRSFSPFKDGINKNNIFEIVKGIQPNKKKFKIQKDNLDLFHDTLNKAKKDLEKKPLESQILGLFCNATTELVKEKYPRS